MDLPSSEIVAVIYALLPGFLAAWIFHGLTPHPRLGAFERVVQALIFTGIAQAVVVTIRWTALLLGGIGSIGTWTDGTSYVFSIVIAVLMGIGFAFCANTDCFHKVLRDGKWFEKFGGITKRTSFPSEWFSAFNMDQRYVVLHLSGERRLYGWPYEWPDHPDSGHFVIMQPEWLLDDNSRAPLHEVEQVLVSGTDVKMVEFVKYSHELSADKDEVESTAKTLIALHKEDKDSDAGQQRSREGDPDGDH